MIYGYLRVSSDVQDVNSQKQGVDKFAELHEWNIGEYIKDEGVSGGVSPEKRKLGILIEKLQKDDVVICSEISRLGRDLYMVMEILHHCMEIGAKIYTVKDNFILGNDIQSKVLAFAFGLSAEIERQMIQQRTKEGLRLRVKNGVLVGRPLGKKTKKRPNTPTKINEIETLLKQGMSKRKIAQELHIGRSSVNNWLAEANSIYVSKDVIANKKERDKRKRQYDINRAVSKKPFYKDEPFCIVNLPREKVIDLILQDKTIPEIQKELDTFSYEQVYDTILCDYEFNALYRKHGQLKVKKVRY